MGTRDSESLHCYTFFRLFHIIKKDEKFNFKNNSNFSRSLRLFHLLFSHENLRLLRRQFLDKFRCNASRIYSRYSDTFNFDHRSIFFKVAIFQFSFFSFLGPRFIFCRSTLDDFPTTTDDERKIHTALRWKIFELFPATHSFPSAQPFSRSSLSRDCGMSERKLNVYSRSSRRCFG